MPNDNKDTLGWFQPFHESDWNNGRFWLIPPQLKGQKRYDYVRKTPDAGCVKITKALTRARVRWPDGKEEVVNIKMVTEYGADSDMGHSYSWASDVPHIALDHHGAEVLTPLCDAGVLVQPLATTKESK
jgi:hypothetical protein